MALHLAIHGASEKSSKLDHRLTPVMSNTLGALARGKQNNLTLIRFLAATAVIFAHSLAFFDLTEQYDPVFILFGIGAGDLAVNVFFVVSGFLITRSWLSKLNLVDFAWARAARIYPALWASSLLLVLAAGMLFSLLPLHEFLLLPTTISYLVKNSTMFFGAQLSLPGTIEGADMGFNVPLWTLPHELQMYALVALLGIAGLIGRRPICASIVVASFAIWILSESGAIDLTQSRFRLMFHFFFGACLLLWKDHIRLGFSGLLASVVLLAVVATLVPVDARKYCLALLTPFLALWFAFVPSGRIRKFSRAGDYSYGLYIFAYPLQLVVLIKMPWIGASGHFALSFACTLLLAMASWHFLERKALQSEKPAWVESLKRVIGRYVPRVNSGLLSTTKSSYD